MTITDRIIPILSSIEYQLTRSLPVINNQGKEVVFFYKVKELDETHYSITEIRYVVFIDIKTGKIEIKGASDVFPATLLKEIYSAVNKYPSDVEADLAYEDEYLSLYDKAFENLCSMGRFNDSFTNGLSFSFHKSVEGTCLKSVYVYLANDFVNSLK